MSGRAFTPGQTLTVSQAYKRSGSVILRSGELVRVVRQSPSGAVVCDLPRAEGGKGRTGDGGYYPVSRFEVAS